MQWFNRMTTAVLSIGAIGFAGFAIAQDKKADAPKEDKPAAAATTAEVGKPAPAFELKGIDGKTVKLADLKDKVVVLEWFNMECPVCVNRIPVMKQTEEKYTKQGVVWIAVDSTHFRKAEQNVEFAKKEKINYPILMDNDGKVGKAYDAKTTPHMFVINKGTLAYAGAIDSGDSKTAGDRNYVAEALDAILASKPVATSSTKAFGCSVKYKKD
ncbi:MAG: redoxin domain-containing protein [Phycisphaerae bacterium]